MKSKELKEREIILLNSEGPILKGKLDQDKGSEIALYNTQDEIVDILSIEEFKDFIYNDRPLIYTDGREMIWSKISESMKVDSDSIENFINGNSRKKLKELVYIASPYSHPDERVRHENYLIVTKIAGDLVSRGMAAISPITYGHVIADYTPMPTDWNFWMDFCLALLVKCDRILVCNTIHGWENSRGVAAEIEFAKQNGIKIEYLKK
jgi:hypothetical protein